MRLLRRLFTVSVIGLAAIAALSLVSERSVIAQIRAAFVKNVDEPGRNPFVQQLSLTSPSGGCGLNFCNSSVYTVPSSRRLVLTRFTGQMALGTGATPARIRLSRSGPSGGSIEIPYNPFAIYTDSLSVGSPRRYVFNEETLLYLEAGESLSLFLYVVGGNLDGSWPQEFTISGYLVDLGI